MTEIMSRQIADGQQLKRNIEIQVEIRVYQ
jgi:hypothetical protein